MTVTESPGKATDRSRVFEIVAVGFTGFCKFLLVDYLGQKFWFVTIACMGWLIHILYRMRKNNSLPNYWGFRKEGFKSSLKVVLPLAIVAILTFVIVGTVRNTLILNWHMLPILILYPIWGTIQQFLIIGLIARNLSDFENHKIPKSVVVVASSVVFSVVHYPSIPLMAATFVLALLYTLLYLKYINLWILGLFHGWLACFFYYFVLGRDPWLEFISAIQ
jgi:hypothetical protein